MQGSAGRCSPHKACCLPVMRSSWALIVRRLSQAGSPHSLSRPLQAAVASSCPSGEKAQSTRGRSSPRSLLMAVTCSQGVGHPQEGALPVLRGWFRGLQASPQLPEWAAEPAGSPGGRRPRPICWQQSHADDSGGQHLQGGQHPPEGAMVAPAGRAGHHAALWPGCTQALAASEG